MLSRTYSAALFGIDGFAVTVECAFEEDVSYFEIVGLPDNAVRESKQRILNATASTGIDLTECDIIFNLAPADRRKEGSALDLAMIAALWQACGAVKPDPDRRRMYLGELAFSGEVRPVRGVLSMALCARDEGFTELFVPAANAAEAACVGGITVYGVRDLREFLRHLKGEKKLAPTAFTEPDLTLPV